MNSIRFPKVFSGNSTKLVKDDDATLNNLHLLLSSECGELFGDPDFGVRIKKYTFNQNSYVLKDILIDELYAQITTFCPQVYLSRDNIEITQDGHRLNAKITVRNKLDYQLNTYNLVLLEEDED